MRRLFQRLYQDTMLVGADHEVRTGTPPAVLVEMPARLDPLDRCAAIVAGRRRKGDQICSLHGVSHPTRASRRQRPVPPGTAPSCTERPACAGAHQRSPERPLRARRRLNVRSPLALLPIDTSLVPKRVGGPDQIRLPTPESVGAPDQIRLPTPESVGSAGGWRNGPPAHSGRDRRLAPNRDVPDRPPSLPAWAFRATPKS